MNVEWAVKRRLETIADAESIQTKIEIACETAQNIADKDAEFCRLPR